MTPKDAVTRGLDIYRTEMRDVIRRALQSEFGDDWCRTQVAPLFGSRKASQIRGRLNRGDKPEDQVDIGQFQQVIAAHQQLFPEGIRKGEHHNHMSKIAHGRNESWAHALLAVYRADVEELFGWCIEVLEQCGRVTAAAEIRDITSALAAAQGAAPVQSTTPSVWRIPRWGWGVLVGVVVVSALLLYFLELRDSLQQQIFDRIYCSPVEAETGETVHCSPVSESPDLLRVPDTFYWRGGGDPATGNGTEFKTIFKDSGRHVIQLNVRSGDEHEGHGIAVTIAEQSVSQGTARAEIEPSPTSQNAPQIPEPSSDLSAGLSTQEPDGPDVGVDEFSEPSSLSAQESQQIRGSTLDGGPQTIAGRIVMRVVERPSGLVDDTWRVEFGFMPEAILVTAESLSAAIEANRNLLPTARYLSGARLYGDQRWLRSSRIDIPLPTSGRGDSATVSVIARSHPSESGTFRLEFGVLPEWAWAITDGDLQAAATHALLPGNRFVTDDLIARELERSEPQWLVSDVVEVPIQHPRLQEHGFVRCGDDSIRVFYLNTDLGTKHYLNISGEAATRILGASWWDTIGWMSAAECAQRPTGNPYDEHDVQEIESPADSLSGHAGRVTYLGNSATTASALAAGLGTGSTRVISKCEMAGWGSLFAIIDNVVLPGSEDFTVLSGDSLWIGEIIPPDELCGPGE